MTPINLKKYLAIFFLAELLLAYAPAYAQTNGTSFDYANQAGVSKQIEKYLCAPTPANPSQTSSYNSTQAAQQQVAAGNTNAGDLYRCINQLYKLAIIIACVVGVFFLVIAGYIYMSAAGNTESTTKAKDILTTTIASLVILFAGYLLLKTINPDLITFQTIQPSSIVPPTNTGSVGAPAGSNAPQSSCNNCSTLTSAQIPVVSSSIQASQTVIAKLQALAHQPSLARITWMVTSAYDFRPDPKDCHNSGTCADLVVSPSTNDNWSALCTAVKNVGFSTVLNEATGDKSTTCQSYWDYHTYDVTSGPNIHVVP